ncbi:hypothetical protein GCM10008967_28100 [Bacillus carboniphilus]|uniref:DUF3221 domain-containing protein n=1 Tax=Bacillus carboniphilus TaxID=86663 RepID=A0ABP3G5V8_9BACI
MNKHIKKELFLLSIMIVVIIIGVISAWLLFNNSLSPKIYVRESTVEKVDIEEGTVTIQCVQSKVDNIRKFKEGQKVKVWFSIPYHDVDAWYCDKINIKDIEIIE